MELTKVLNKVFPEFKPLFKSRFSATVLYILSNYSTPEKISNMNYRSYDALRRLSRGKFTMNSFVQLKTMARNTVGHCNDLLIHEMEILLDIYNQMDARIQELEEQIVAYVEGIDPPLLAIPGIGALSATVILSEYGDMNNSDTPAKLFSFAGLEPGGQSEHTTAWSSVAHHIFDMRSCAVVCLSLQTSRVLPSAMLKSGRIVLP